MCATVQEIMNGNHLWNDRRVVLYAPGHFMAGAYKFQSFMSIRKQTEVDFKPVF
jgi:hypothetical protein